MEESPKRSVGRPRRTPQTQTIPRSGIVSDAINPDNIIEMSYDNVVVFKKLFSLLKNMTVKEITFQFSGSHIFIFGIDHLEKNTIHIKINPLKLNRYYCEQPVSVCVDTKNLDKITQKIDKNYELISFILKKDSYRNNLLITLNNEALSIDESHVIRLMESDNNDNSFMNRVFNFVDYPLKFELPGKYFKKIMNDIYSFNEVFTIEKVAVEPLNFTYKNLNNTVKGYHICKDSKKINLETTLSENDIFSVSVQIDYIKSISNSLLSDSIKVYAHSEKDLVLSMPVDSDVIEVTTFISINKYN